MFSADDIIAALRLGENAAQREILMRFFKCGEGDKFLGLKVPQTRAVVKEAKLKVSFPEIEKLLYCPWHEVRLAGFLLLVEEMKAASKVKRQSALGLGRRRQEIVDFYLRHARQANNWDLVDLSCTYILGPWLLMPDDNGCFNSRDVLFRLAQSDNLWEQRISIVTTWLLIRADEYDTTLMLAEKLLTHPHDLIHKAVGWMLREVGKRNLDVLRGFLQKHSAEMPRTMLRYSIEKMSHHERQMWLKK